MKTSTKQLLMGLALSSFSISLSAQCPTTVNATIVSNTNNGNLTVSQSFGTPTNSTTAIHNYYTLTNGSYSAYGNSSSAFGSALLSNVPSGTYTLCVHDSISGCPTISSCIPVTITNTVVAPACHASFNYHTDSSCVTHFVNTSTGTGYTAVWEIDGTAYSIPSPAVSLANGYHFARFIQYNPNGSVCDSVGQYVSIACAGGTITPATCNASFYIYSDSSCATHFVNTSTGSGLTYQWNIDGNSYSSANPVVSLSNGNHNVWLTTLSGGSFCDSTYQSINVSCGGGTTVIVTPCVANAQFSVFADSLHAGNYFAYNFSSGTGSVSYLWNFGDGTTSTQQYPFHNYATPGQYIICLTLTATNGTTTCTDSYCDSSSVHRIASGFFMSQFNVIPQAVTSVKEENAIKTLKAFPNPMLDELTLEIELTQANTKLAYTLVDAVGRIAMTNSISDSKTVINTSTLEKGFYFLSISNEQGKTIKTTKLVK